MVSSTVVENGETIAPVVSSSPAVGVPPGDYRLVGWDMDATGRRLIDEICQIAGYTPSSSYGQYVMPFKDLNPPARKRHNIRVVTIGKYRMLKDNKTNKVLKTKSEISALIDFITWLESVKGDAADGVILVYHEPRKVIPSMLLESLRKFNLLDRFKQTVKGFANGFNVAEVKCADTVRTFSLRTLSRVMLDKEEELDNAVDRARLALQVIQHLSAGEETAKGAESSGSGDSDAATKGTIELIREFVQPTHVEEKELAGLKLVLNRQNSLRPVFGMLLRQSRRERQHASLLRRLLAEANVDYVELQEVWSNEKREGLQKLIKEKVTGAKENEEEELLEVLECHFDPEKKMKPKLSVEKKVGKKGNIGKGAVESKENIKNESATESPDTTTTSSPLKEKLVPQENAEVKSSDVKCE
ncbi:maternal protein exuperantia [Neodiprion virginianus]|uniref:maternal protein exuperantia n=1 Tax=Neodiprion fabricii TaxID=2872261 RepID=UPI001ED8CC85|nr:maternal protein exuperantia [Neodiprion fabricii]XP_046433575.1 maternal protein exuperantia [Neodiprion fabricii]XP_046433576.1 maternal protein exuperantia [Neodiprion fabricii]XP_046627557.1 maternal protein exuperantia [Neodiprion virginianus]XP_046627559.1 maternal protein exuperantia [Neodiprion virginianus]XP_046627560.1 maternal protein exuperantia [Neodiprion virginianus]